MTGSASAMRVRTRKVAAFSLAIVAILLFFFGLGIGYKYGEDKGVQCVTTREYTVANIHVLVVGVLVSALIWASGWLMLAGIAVGGMAGALVGLKLTFGESVGPWKVHDRVLHVNKDQLRRAGSKNAEAVRRARRDGTPMPEVMSVAPDEPEETEGGPTRSKHKK